MTGVAIWGGHMGGWPSRLHGKRPRKWSKQNANVQVKSKCLSHRREGHVGGGGHLATLATLRWPPLSLSLK